MKLLIGIFVVLFIMILSDPNVEKGEETTEKKIPINDKDKDGCPMGFRVPKKDEIIEFRFPSTDNVTRTTNVDRDNYVMFKASDIPLPKGIGLYFRTEPFNESLPRFVKNKYMDSGVNMKLLNGTRVIYPDENKLFLNYRYQSIPTERKCRAYDVWIRFSMNEMIKYGRHGVNDNGMFLELGFHYGYFIRNLNQTTAEEPFFIHSPRYINAVIGIKKNESDDEDDDDDDEF